MNNKNQGHIAEFWALQYLRLKGYALISNNYTTGKGTGAGEIDLIVKKQNILAFIEVKKRQTLTSAAYAIQPRQQQRIRRGAEAFLATHPEYADFDIRFDAILIESPFKIKHIENAF